MRVLLLAIFLGVQTCVSSAQEKGVTTFQGTGGTTTGPFQVSDRWEVQWVCPDLLAITLFASDGTIVAGTSGSGSGSFFLPKAGSYYLQVSRAQPTATSPWHISVVQVGAATGGTNVATFYVPPATLASPASTNTISISLAPPAAVSVSATTASAPSVPATNAPPTAPAQFDLTEDQAHAVVVIKGDYMEGTGFLARTADGPAVVTNLHVISANPNVKILTTTGEQIKTLSLKGASDRDLAMFMIQDNHYSYLDLATDMKDTVQTDDEVITPGNSEGGEVVLNTHGKVLGIGPERIEIDNPIYHGNSGGPIFHTKSGKVLAVVTQAMKVNVSNDLDKASFENKNSAIIGSMRYFGLRLDTVPHWEVYDWNRFLNETTFLKNFHEQSRCLDSFLNGARYEQAHIAVSDENGPPDSQYYLRNEKIVSAHDDYHKLSVDADNSQVLDARRELIMELEGVGDTDMDTIKTPANFYSFDQLRAAQELRYRDALRSEIEKFGDNISDLGH